ncbi:MAG: MFS transporter [Planctomycetota bacterium]|nr:MFS transporter [Planctomycetota bacterium]
MPSDFANSARNIEDSVPSVYGRVFWLSCVGNFALVAGNALTFRFAELVAYLNGTEETTGQIVRVGILGALASRLVLGQLLDHYGTRRVWVISTLIFGAGCFGFLFCREIGPLIYLCRIGFAVGVAGMSTTAILHIQNQVPRERRTEIIGNFGSSGFVGLVCGTQAGDLIFRVIDNPDHRFQILFGLAGVLSILYLGIVLLMLRGVVHDRPEKTPPVHRLVFRYWPGAIVLVAIFMGVGLTVTTVFLTRLTTHRSLGGIGTFFLGYCGCAFLFRVAASGWARVIGRHWLVILGLLGHGTGHVVLAFATEQWHLVPAALTCGFGHALLFPSVVSLGAGPFPREYRGTGTAIILGFTEVGIAASAPFLGWIIDQGVQNHNSDPFAPMLFFTAGTAGSIAIIYGWLHHNTEDEETLMSGDGDVLGALGLSRFSKRKPKLQSESDTTIQDRNSSAPSETGDRGS